MNQQEQKRQTELSAWHNAYKYIHKKHCTKFAAQYLKMFKQCSINSEWRDRPDLRLGNDDIVIGIEHFLLDYLAQNRQSHQRPSEKQSMSLFETYKDGKIEGNEVQAIDSLMSAVQNEVNKVADMNSVAIEQELTQTLAKHSFLDYRNNLPKNKTLYLGLLIELRYSKIPRWRIYKKNQKQDIAINGVPITYNMVKVLESNPDIDFILLYMADMHNQHKRSVILDAKNLLRSIQENNLVLCDKFESPHKGLYLTDVTVQPGQDCVNIGSKFNINKPKGGKNGKT